ncbi:hypothetical protein Pelo_1806 [Pelomyxa schiedti]|nr:hypothetical protein Pelo_1806 [Pelomyxa schiedti]
MYVVKVMKVKWLSSSSDPYFLNPTAVPLFMKEVRRKPDNKEHLWSKLRPSEYYGGKTQLPIPKRDSQYCC